MATSITDIHPDIIQTNILPRLDGRSLSTVATISSDLNTLCSDNNLWSHICMCMWPSITHPDVEAIISTFPGGHKSFFQDAFPSLITDHNINQPDCSSCYLDNSQLVSVVDIRYQTDIIYSAVQFSDTTSDFLWSEFLIKLTEEHGAFSRSLIDIKVNEPALLHLKESMTLNWIIIDPTLKRAGNLSTIKPVSVKRDWVSNKIIVKYVTVLPGCEPNEMVRCRILVVLGTGQEGGVGEGLRLKEVTMKLLPVDSCWLSGGDFLVISQRAILGVNNVRRKALDDKEIWERWCAFKEMIRQRRELARKEEENRKNHIVMDYIWVFMLICFYIYLLS